MQGYSYCVKRLWKEQKKKINMWEAPLWRICLSNYCLWLFTHVINNDDDDGDCQINRIQSLCSTHYSVGIVLTACHMLSILPCDGCDCHTFYREVNWDHRARKRQNHNLIHSDFVIKSLFSEPLPNENLTIFQKKLLTWPAKANDFNFQNISETPKQTQGGSGCESRHVPWYQCIHIFFPTAEQGLRSVPKELPPLPAQDILPHLFPQDLVCSRNMERVAIPFFLTQGSNPCLLHCRWILYSWAAGKVCH